MRTKLTTPSFPARLIAVRNILATGKIVRAIDIANAIGISERSIYRYVEALRALGNEIVGEAGVGYQMVKNGTMKPLAQLEIYETLAASYERSAVSLRGQGRDADKMPAKGAFYAAAYTVDALRAGALDVVAKLKDNG